MQALASFTMRGRSQAALVAVACALLSILVPLIGLASSAVVALVTLRKGGGEGLIVGTIAGLASGLLALLALGNALPAIGFALVLWLPAWVLGLILRQSRSLNLTVQLAALFGLLILLVIHLQVADPVAYWQELLEPMRVSLVERGVVDNAMSERLVGQVSHWMTGAFASTFYLQLLIALFIGRWWQAVLYNPGGFGSEFRALRVFAPLAYAALGLLAAASLLDGATWAVELLLLLAPAFFFQGVAVVHTFVHAAGANLGWLIGFYALLILVMPHAEILVAIVGLVDVWADFRARVTARRAGQD